jgi:hypothetical protein
MTDILDALDVTADSGEPSQGKETGGTTVTQDSRLEETQSEGEPDKGKWHSHLPKEIRDNPDTDANEQTWADFYAKLGKPKTPEGYSIAKAAQEDEGAQVFSTMAFENHLTDAQATKVYNSLNARTQGMMKAMYDTQAQELDAVGKAMQKDYGKDYDAKVAAFKRGLASSKSIKDTLQTAGLLGKKSIVEAFIALGEARTEDFSPKGGSGAKAKDYMGGNWYT